jgi:hypothetical protein
LHHIVGYTVIDISTVLTAYIIRVTPLWEPEISPLQTWSLILQRNFSAFKNECIWTDLTNITAFITTRRKFLSSSFQNYKHLICINSEFPYWNALHVPYSFKKKNHSAPLPICSNLGGKYVEKTFKLNSILHVKNVRFFVQTHNFLIFVFHVCVKHTVWNFAALCLAVLLCNKELG